VSLETSKAALRKEYRRYRTQLFIDDSWLHILNCKELDGVTHVATYISYGVEPQTRDINLQLLASGRIVLVPRMLPDKDLEWVVWNGESEPTGSAFTDTVKISAVIIPALHIDQEGNRLGQGGGSYDRALAQLKAGNVWKIALIHHGELTSDALPHEPHDQKVDAAATPNLVVRFK